MKRRRKNATVSFDDEGDESPEIEIEKTGPIKISPGQIASRRINDYGKFVDELGNVTKNRRIKSFELIFNNSTDTLGVKANGDQYTDSLYILVEPITNYTYIIEYKPLYARRDYTILIQRIINDKFNIINIKEEEKEAEFEELIRKSTRMRHADFDRIERRLRKIDEALARGNPQTADPDLKKIPSYRDIYKVTREFWDERMHENTLSVITPARELNYTTPETKGVKIIKKIERPVHLSGREWIEKEKLENDMKRELYEQNLKRIAKLNKNDPAVIEFSIMKGIWGEEKSFEQLIEKKSSGLIRNIIKGEGQGESLPQSVTEMSNFIINKVTPVKSKKDFGIYMFCFVTDTLSAMRNKTIKLDTELSRTMAIEGYKYRVEKQIALDYEPKEPELWSPNLIRFYRYMIQIIKKSKVSPLDIFSYILIEMIKFEDAMRDLIGRKSKSIVFKLIKDNNNRFHDLAAAKIELSEEYRSKGYKKLEETVKISIDRDLREFSENVMYKAMARECTSLNERFMEYLKEHYENL